MIPASRESSASKSMCIPHYGSSPCWWLARRESAENCGTACVSSGFSIAGCHSPSLDNYDKPVATPPSASSKPPTTFEDQGPPPEKLKKGRGRGRGAASRALLGPRLRSLFVFTFCILFLFGGFFRYLDTRGGAAMTAAPHPGGVLRVGDRTEGGESKPGEKTSSCRGPVGPYVAGYE